MEDKENAIDPMTATTATATTTADRHQPQRGAGGKDAATHGEMLPLSSEAAHSLIAAAAATATAVAATPRSIGGARVAHFAATPLGQRTAGDASSVRRERDEKRGTTSNWRGGDGARRQTVFFFFLSGLPLRNVCSRLVPSEVFFEPL